MLVIERAHGSARDKECRSCCLCRRWAGILLCAGLLLTSCHSSSPLRYAENPESSPEQHYGPEPSCAKLAARLSAQNVNRFKCDPDMLVLPGLVASRRANRVEVLAEGTGARGGDTVEFLLVDQTSSHGYEAVLWSYAKPSDIHKALVFLGMKPGEPFNPDNLQFWAEGERVDVSLVTDEGESKDKPFRIEQLIRDIETQKTLPEDGFVFSGSMTTAATAASQPLYAADCFDPKSIVSIYNEPCAVLDVPRHAPQGELYGRQVANPGRSLRHGELVTVILTPQIADPARRVRNIVMDILPTGEPCSGSSESIDERDAISKLAFTISEEGAKGPIRRTNVSDALTSLAEMTKDGATVYLTVSFDRVISLAAIQRVALILALSEEKLRIRIKPPVSGQLYYKAFLPDLSWRLPEARPSQPWELRLAKQDGKLSGSLSFNDRDAIKGRLEPKFSSTAFNAASPQAVRHTIDAETARRKNAGLPPIPSVLFVFADKHLSYGELLDFLAPVLPSHNTIHLFFKQADGPDR